MKIIKNLYKLFKIGVKKEQKFLKFANYKIKHNYLKMKQYLLKNLKKK